jgi:hypothetical protein
MNLVQYYVHGSHRSHSVNLWLTQLVQYTIWRLEILYRVPQNMLTPLLMGYTVSDQSSEQPWSFEQMHIVHLNLNVSPSYFFLHLHSYVPCMF